MTTVIYYLSPDKRRFYCITVGRHLREQTCLASHCCAAASAVAVHPHQLVRILKDLWDGASKAVSVLTLEDSEDDLSVDSMNDTLGYLTTFSRLLVWQPMQSNTASGSCPADKRHNFHPISCGK